MLPPQTYLELIRSRSLQQRPTKSFSSTGIASNRGSQHWHTVAETFIDRLCACPLRCSSRAAPMDGALHRQVCRTHTNIACGSPRLPRAAAPGGWRGFQGGATTLVFTVPAQLSPALQTCPGALAGSTHYGLILCVKRPRMGCPQRGRCSHRHGRLPGDHALV